MDQSIKTTVQAFLAKHDGQCQVPCESCVIAGSVRALQREREASRRVIATLMDCADESETLLEQVAALPKQWLALARQVNQPLVRDCADELERVLSGTSVDQEQSLDGFWGRAYTRLNARLRELHGAAQDAYRARGGTDQDAWERLRDALDRT